MSARRQPARRAGRRGALTRVPRSQVVAGQRAQQELTRRAQARAAQVRRAHLAHLARTLRLVLFNTTWCYLTPHAAVALAHSYLSRRAPSQAQ